MRSIPKNASLCYSLVLSLKLLLGYAVALVTLGLALVPKFEFNFLVLGNVWRKLDSKEENTISHLLSHLPCGHRTSHFSISSLSPSFPRYVSLRQRPFIDDINNFFSLSTLSTFGADLQCKIHTVIPITSAFWVSHLHLLSADINCELVPAAGPICYPLSSLLTINT